MAGQGCGPDRLRFLGMLSRYVGVLTTISLDENQGRRTMNSVAQALHRIPAAGPVWPPAHREPQNRPGRSQVGPRHLRALQHGFERQALCRPGARRAEAPGIQIRRFRLCGVLAQGQALGRRSGHGNLGRWTCAPASGSNARKAYYVPNKTTPMAYGFGAVALPEPGSVSFEEARKQILAKGK